ncbi:LRRC48-like protein [Saccoglossus kowalevskii]|uniref:Dynein regulatory complex subunit 3 n=1 Tax=Saccoglossus kowalevskii TaxID=10224 RepID=D1LX59_SACKO|nr:LRRC48-like protein [Saccoglossus kowalevskii]ACY92565.1 LRRC48-like protein [Saccoglossus kowalevskii]
MSRLYDTVEPAVIDEEMLLKAVEEQGPKEEAGRIAKQEGIDFCDVVQLRLDFKNILKIDNLWQFTRLTKLQLDNNIIEKIEGLDQLVNLIWLDLSFNNIEIIEGFDKLTKLEDLTLYNNRISVIENMDALTKLHVLSVGNNNIEQLENVKYLRRFKNLQTLNLSGNEFCDDGNYKAYIVAHIPSLVYLDFRLIDESTRVAANEQYKYSIEELEADENAEERKRVSEKEKQDLFELHKSAYVENLNGPFLFDSMFFDDTEGPKLASLPGVEELLITFKEKFTEICQQLFEFGLQEHAKRKKEVSEFFECIEDAKKENKDIAAEKIDSFLAYKKKLFSEIQHMSDQKVLDSRIEEYHKEVNVIWDQLMGYELQLVDQLEETIKEFDRNMADMVSLFVENVQAQISQCRELENQHHEKLLEIAVITLEKFVKNELDDDVPDETKLLLVDKDTIQNAVSASHDLHLLKIDNREDEIITRANNWMAALMEQIHQDEEIKRNRDRICEINNLIDHLNDELDNLDLHGGL